jgi:phosphoglycolate phosphatase-like HAD superfamily hydrolase
MGYQGAIFDADGVLVDSPHELAWREALKELLEGDWRDIRDRTSWTAERFTTQVYQQRMAGKPRLAGARAALEYFGVPDVDRRTERYADAKQEQVLQLIEQGRFRAFPDALRFILPVKNSGIRVAAASSSKNAKLFLERIRLDTLTAEQHLDFETSDPSDTAPAANERGPTGSPPFVPTVMDRSTLAIAGRAVDGVMNTARQKGRPCPNQTNLLPERPPHRKLRARHSGRPRNLEPGSLSLILGSAWNCSQRSPWAGLPMPLTLVPEFCP